MSSIEKVLKLTQNFTEAIENSAKETLLSIGDDRGNRRYNTVAGMQVLALFGLLQGNLWQAAYMIS